MATRLSLTDGETLIVEQEYGEVNKMLRAPGHQTFMELTEFHTDAPGTPVTLAISAVRYMREKKDEQKPKLDPNQGPTGGLA